MRDFQDQAGDCWLVYAIRKAATESATRRYLPDVYQDGWLVFESGERKLRLAPIPPGWDDMSDAELHELLAQARPVTPTEPHGRPAYQPQVVDRGGTERR